MNLFGLEIKSREEREQEEREYLLRIFPGGAEQKAEVEQELKRRLPAVDTKAVMLYYILVRDAMTSKKGATFEDAAKKVGKKQHMLNATPEILDVVRSLMEG